MKIGDNSFDTKSSFKSIEKDFGMIINRLLKNETLKKLLYYTTDDCLDRPNLDKMETLSLVNKQIQIIPRKFISSNEAYPLVNIMFDNFMENGTNPEFRDNIIIIDILCHYDQWNLGNFQLRPYKIAGEIDGLLNDKYLTGIGRVKFMSGQMILADDEIGGITLVYSAIHGEDDKIA